MPLTCRVKYAGIGSAKTDLLLLKDGKEVARRTVDLSPLGPSDVHFLVAQDAPGLDPYEVRATPLAGEVSQANNAASYLLRVVDEPIRVLVLEGKPYWDSKCLVRTLAEDPAVALDSIIRLADNRLLRRTLSKATDAATRPATQAAAVPPATTQDAGAHRTETWKILTDAADVLGTPDRLRGYQIVVLGRDAEVFLTEPALANLQEWIARDGGSLVCYRGAPTTTQVNQRLAKLLPVTWTPDRESRFRVTLTDQGKDLQWVGGNAAALSNLPMLVTDTRVDANKARGVVLATRVSATGQQVPAVVYQSYGSGRVGCLEGAGMWRWAFLPPTARDGDDAEVYGSLWHSLLRWLISNSSLLPGQKMTLRTDKVSFNTGEDATVTLLTREEGAGALPGVELLADGSSEPRGARPVPAGDEPGTYRVNFGKLPEGRYHARVAGAPGDDAGVKTVFDVKLLGEEQLNLAARPDLMKRIADDSGGVVLASDDEVGKIAKVFDEYMEKAHTTAVRRVTAWDRAWVLLVVLGVWARTLVLRRSGGLV